MRRTHIPTLQNFINGMLFGLLAVILLATSVGCSYHWRESDPGVDGQYVMSVFDEIAGQSSMFVNSGSLGDLRNDPYATFYFSHTGPMGPLSSVFSFSDTSFLGSVFNQPIPYGATVFDLQYGYGVSDASIIFYDSVSPTTGARYFTLMIKLTGSGGTSYFTTQSAPNDYSMTDTTFETRMPVSGGTLVLRSYDLSPDYEDELAPSIKLNAYLIEQGTGIEYEIGQFSILHGFGGAI